MSWSSNLGSQSSVPDQLPSWMCYFLMNNEEMCSVIHVSISTIHFYIKWCNTSQYHMQIHGAFPDDEGCQQPLCKVITGIFRNRWDRLAPQWVGTIPKNNTIHTRLLVIQFSQKFRGTSRFHSFPPSHDVTSVNCAYLPKLRSHLPNDQTTY